MGRIRKLFIRAATSIRDPESAWYKKTTWYIVFFAVLLLVVLWQLIRRWRIARLEARAHNAEKRSERLLQEATIEEKRVKADKLLEKASLESEEASLHKRKADAIITEYLEEETRIALTKDWDSLKEYYEKLD